MLEKKCNRCKAMKEMVSFGICRTTKDGLNPTCKICAKELYENYKLRLKTNPKKEIKEKKCFRCKQIKSADQFYKSAYKYHGLDSYCKDCGRVKSRILAKNYRDNHYRYKEKFIVIAHYSMGEMCCRVCRNPDIRCLQIDHINGNGAEHRKKISAGKLYAWLIRNDFPEGYQVLCANHNVIKRIENKESKLAIHDVIKIQEETDFLNKEDSWEDIVASGLKLGITDN